ncbi:thiamine-monophosphate kinase [Verrucomicrobia bacterium LW23]|nr:thiamine-monophosphate kinase [Verrucomicrobia bacterium LW23]
MPDRTLPFRSEDALWQELTRHWPVCQGNVVVGVGDDCAVLRGDSPAHHVLFKTDIVVQDAHFTAATPPRLVGRKALCRAVSDIAAMGGRPGAALVTLGLPRPGGGDSALPSPSSAASAKFFSANYLRAVYQGLKDAAAECGVSLAGGETSRARQFFLNIALLGETRGYTPVLRSTARPGDLIWVTGRLGNTQKRRHLTFTPRLAEGQFLAAESFATAMMDISDGLGRDLPRLARASRLGCSLHYATIPRNRGADLRAAMSDGEDFELLFTTAIDRADELRRRWHFPCSITCIGQMSAKHTGRRAWSPPENWIDGYDHLKQP